MGEDDAKQQPETDDITTAKAPVFKNKEEHKREVNRLRSIKNERKMKLTDRSDDVLPTPDKSSLSIETYYREDSYSEPDATAYLNGLFSDDTVTCQSTATARPPSPPPPIPAANCGTLLIGIALAAVIAIILQFFN